MQSTYSLNSIDRIASFLGGASQNTFIQQWNRSKQNENVTRGIELPEFSILNYGQQTSEFADLIDLLPQPIIEEVTTKDIRDSSITLEIILAEHSRRLAEGAFESNTSLADRWAKPDLDLSDEELAATLNQIGSEWEQNLDDFFRED